MDGETGDELTWARRLYLPVYTTAEAARYARIAPSTLRHWHCGISGREPLLARKERGIGLSYLQLVETAFVASFRKAGVPLSGIRRARDYLRAAFQTAYPFSSLRLKTEGRSVLLELSELEPLVWTTDLVSADHKGQIAWPHLLADRFQEFEYLDGLAVTWHVAGRASPVIIDPRYAFGSPSVRGVATWSISARYRSGEPPEFIAEDVGLKAEDVCHALRFEGVKVLQ